MTDRGILGTLHPSVKLLLLVVLMLASMMVITFIGLLFAIPFTGVDILSQLEAMSENLNLMRYVQLLSHVGLFVVPAIIFGFLLGKNPLSYYRATHVSNIKIWIIAALIMVAIVPVVYILWQLNQHLNLPEFMAGLEEWMRRSESDAERMMEQLLNVTSFQAYLFNLMLIAVLPGLGEELIFRGVIQRIFIQWTKNIHIAVIITAILFSAMHLQFYSFLPRVALGIALGYMYVITGNIWIPVFAHFFNNAAAVTLYYVSYNSGVFDSEVLTQTQIPHIVIIMSVIAVSLLFYLLIKLQQRMNRLDRFG